MICVNSCLTFAGEWPQVGQQAQDFFSMSGYFCCTFRF